MHDPSYPTPAYLRSITRTGNIRDVGDTAAATPGSDLIEEVLLDDRPGQVFLQAWGGPNTIARALLSIQEEYEGTPEWEAVHAKVSAKAVLTSWGQQDTTFVDYIRPNWPDLEHREVATNIWGYFARGAVPGDQASKLGAAWMQANVSSVGPLGAEYRVWGEGEQMAAGFDDEDYFGLSGYTADELRAMGYLVWGDPLEHRRSRGGACARGGPPRSTAHPRGRGARPCSCGAPAVGLVPLPRRRTHPQGEAMWSRVVAGGDGEDDGRDVDHEREMRSYAPPDNEVGVAVAGPRLVSRTDGAALLLDAVVVHSTGLRIRMALVCRDVPGSAGRHPYRDLEPAVGVELADGTRVLPRLGRMGQPQLHERGGQGGGRRWERELWLSPVPDGDLTVVLGSVGIEVPEGRWVVPGEEIAAARLGVLELWPWTPEVHEDVYPESPLPAGGWFEAAAGASSDAPG